jgi:hypothetical protein
MLTATSIQWNDHDRTRSSPDGSHNEWARISIKFTQRILCLFCVAISPTISLPIVFIVPEPQDKNSRASRINFSNPHISTSASWLSSKKAAEWYLWFKWFAARVGGVAASSQSTRNHFLRSFAERITFGQRISLWNGSFGSPYMTYRDVG